MGYVAVRRGASQSKQNEKAFGIIVFDALTVLGLTWFLSGEWTYGLISFAGVFILLGAISQNKVMAALISFFADARGELGVLH